MLKSQDTNIFRYTYVFSTQKKSNKKKKISKTDELVKAKKMKKKRKNSLSWL